MRVRAVIAALALGLGLGGPALPQTVAADAAPPQGAVILTLDQDRLYAESARGLQIEATMAAENEGLAAENRKIDAALEAEERDLTTRRPLLPAAEFQALAEAFNQKVEGLRQAQLSKAKALEQKRSEARAAFLQSVVPILGQIMQETGAFAILDSSAIILSFERIDITDETIAAIDAADAAGAAPQDPAAPNAPDQGGTETAPSP